MRRTVLAILIVLGVASLPACRLPSRKGPVSKSMVLSRQLSQQGVAAIERGEWQQAASKLSQAVDTCPADSDARRHYAETLWHDGQYEKAVKQLEEANRLAGDDPLLNALIAEKRLAMGQIEAARQNSERALDLDPRLAAAWTARARIMHASGNPREALADYHRALGLAPDDRTVRLEIAETYRALNEPLRALATLDSLADTWPPGEEPQQVLYLQGLAYQALGRHEDAANRLAAACDRGQPSPEILCRLAEAQWSAGRPTQAEATAREALAMDPRHQASRELLARLASSDQPDGTIMR